MSDYLGKKQTKINNSYTTKTENHHNYYENEEIDNDSNYKNDRDGNKFQRESVIQEKRG